MSTTDSPQREYRPDQAQTRSVRTVGAAPEKDKHGMTRRPTYRTMPPLAAIDMGEEIARMMLDRMRADLDRYFTDPAAREGAWRSFLAVAGDWATEDGIKLPGAYQALKRAREKLEPLLRRPSSNTNGRGIPAFPQSKG